ncbi:hypothetical protein [Clostridium baratii]|uniref:hypothetical protein n=1 Tax=Clostridium baratii TaxID=1561 RepID=UPI001C029339|nr:hypothetical protein [Clostridium baratii]MBT9832402.1 hypothetical protein [Clostridium baratii]
MEWDINNINNIVDFINLELNSGRSLAEIERSEFGVNPSVISKRLGRLKYKRINNKFIKQDGGQGVRQSVRQGVRQEDNKVLVGKVTEVIKTADKTIADIVPIRETQEKLISLIDNYDVIMELVEAKKNEIGISIELPNEPGKKETRATIRINKVIWDKFNHFADNNKQFTKKELVSQALKEFMEKYGY